MQLSDQAEIVIVISTGGHENTKVRGDLGNHLRHDVLRLIDVFKGPRPLVGKRSHHPNIRQRQPTPSSSA